MPLQWYLLWFLPSILHLRHNLISCLTLPYQRTSQSRRISTSRKTLPIVSSTMEPHSQYGQAQLPRYISGLMLSLMPNTPQFQYLITRKHRSKPALTETVEQGIIKPVPIGTQVTCCSSMVVVSKADGTPCHTIDFQ